MFPSHTSDTVLGYATDGNIGSHVYDRLIGQTAILYGIARIVTWNVSHMRQLFPDVNVLDPVAFLDATE